ncbi:MAG: PAS domain S-box protein [Paludibacter sp.]|nr:PAS domain S-box protein [Paludibacter sp.]
MKNKGSIELELLDIISRLKKIVFNANIDSGNSVYDELINVEHDLLLTGKSGSLNELSTLGFSIESVIFNQLGFIWIKDIDGRYVVANKAYASLCGVADPVKLIGKYDGDVWTEEIAKRHIDEDNIVFRTGKTVTTEEKISVNDKSERWLETYKAPVYNANSEIIGLTGFSRDITSRKNALDKVRKLSHAVEQSSVSVIITDTEGNIEYVNPNFVQVSGYQKNFVLGKNPRILKGGNTPPEVYHDLWTTITAGNDWYGEFCNRKANGDTYWERAVVSPIRNESGLITNYVAIKEDVTQLKQKERDIQNVTRQLQDITENISEIFCLLDANCEKFLYISPAFEKITGLTPDIIYHDSKSFYNIIHKDDVDDLLYKFNGYKQNLDFDAEFRLKKVNDAYRWIHARIYPVKNHDGKTERHIVIAVDITKQKETEDILRKSEEKYRLITENSSDVIWVYNLNKKRYTFISSAVKSLRGITVEDAMSEKLSDSLDNESIVTMNKLISSNALNFFALGKETVYSIDEIRQKHKDGHFVWVEVSSMLQYNQQGECELIGVSRDITKRKRTEKELESLTRFQNVLVNMSLNYINMKIGDINQNVFFSLRDLSQFIDAERAMIFSYDWEKKCCNCDFEWRDPALISLQEELKVIPLENMPEWVNQHIRGKIFEIRNVENFEGVSRSDLILHGVKSMISIPLMLDNKCIGFITFDSTKKNHNYIAAEKSLLTVFGQLYINLIQRKNLETGLIQEKENALSANKAKSEFLANMSHELRTPLNGVIGFSELLTQTSLTDVQKQYTNAITTSANALLGVINDILDFSKIEANRMELEIVNTDMAKLLGQCVEVISPAAEKKQLELLLDVPADLPEFAYVDPIRLNQILANLLSNAVKFTAQGEVELKVEYLPVTDKHGKFTFTVRDTGIGITEAQREKLFKAFSQADSSTTRKFGGTGLGLIISDMIARKMGGKIELRSEKDKGTEFFFTIEADTEFSKKEFVKFPDEFGQILIIDDNKKSGTIISEMLSEMNIKSEYCESALEAIMILKLNYDFNIILIDNNIFNTSGVDVIDMICSRLSISPLDKQFVVMHNLTEDYLFYEECKDLGVSYFLTKPVSFDQLYKVLLEIQNIADISKTEKKVLSENKGHKDKMFRILIADDDMFNMMLAKAMIGNLLPNVEFTEARSGTDAYNFFRDNEYDLVFMDVQMPEMDGNDATCLIREFEQNRGTHVPIIGLTAGALKEEKEKCLQSGMDEFLTKPIDSNKLKETIINYLNL